MKSKKIILMLSGAAFILGIVLFGIGFSMVDFDITKITTEGETVDKTYSAEDGVEVNKIEVADAGNRIKVVKGKADTIRVHYSENKNRKYSFEQTQDGCFKINESSETKLRWFSIDFTDKELCIEVPETFHGDLDLQTADGSISVTDIDVNDIKLNTSNGAITMENVNCTNITDETMEGRITLDSVNCTNILGKTSDGSIALSELDASEGISLTTGEGSIKGDICGRADDYKINSSTADGGNNLPQNTSGEKILEAHTSDGSIDITFDK